jgi:hypothetical protein
VFTALPVPRRNSTQADESTRISSPRAAIAATPPGQRPIPIPRE